MSGSVSTTTSLKPNAETVNDRAKLIMHHLIVRELKKDPTIIHQARVAIAQARLAGRTNTYLDEWTVLLGKSQEELCQLLVSRSEEMVRLRISSPFPVVINFGDVEVRRRIWRKAKVGARHERG